MMYGTAWKKERTAALVETAVLAGFRGTCIICYESRHFAFCHTVLVTPNSHKAVETAVLAGFRGVSVCIRFGKSCDLHFVAITHQPCFSTVCSL
jgi:hypothetical protein